jgi:hypothetical protein
MPLRNSPSDSLRGRISRHAPSISIAFGEAPPSSNSHGNGDSCALEPSVAKPLHSSDVPTEANEGLIPTGFREIQDPQGFVDRICLSPPPAKRARLSEPGEETVPDHSFAYEAWSQGPNQVGTTNIGHRQGHTADDHCVSQTTPDRQVLTAQMPQVPPSQRMSQSSAEFATNDGSFEYVHDNDEIRQPTDWELNYQNGTGAPSQYDSGVFHPPDQCHSYIPQPLSAMITTNQQAAVCITDSLSDICENSGLYAGSFDFSLCQQGYSAQDTPA